MPSRRLLAVCISQLLLARTADAATIVVDGTGEAMSNDGVCTLPEAIENAGNDSDNGRTMSGECAAGSGADEIQLPAGQTITLTSALPALQGDVSIVGNQARVERTNTACNLDGTTDAGEFRLLSAQSAGQTVVLSDFTLANGCADGAVGPDSQGGALRSDTNYVTLQGMRFEDNQARTDGGAVASFSEGIASLAINSSVFLNNQALGNGGALRTNSMSPLIEDSTFTGNQAADGGAFHHRYGVPTVSRSTFSGNTGTVRGGAISFMRHSASPGQTFTLDESTLDSNTAASGGGIYSIGTVSVQNSTLSGNSSTQGGGIYLSAQGSLQMSDSTLADNVGGGGSQIYWTETSTVSLMRSVLSGTYPACSTTSTYPSGSDNLATDTSCNVVGATVVSAGALALGPLQDNGGPTKTRALALGSTAIDAAGNGCSGTDQRGVARPFGTACDAGAFEVDETATAGPDFVVNALDDAGDGVCSSTIGECTLRDAVIAANSNVDASEITFDPMVFDGSQTITLAAELTPLYAPITLTGLGDTVNRAGGCNLDGVADAGEFRLMRIPYSTSPASISHLTLANGCADDPSDNNGGAVLAGSLSLMLSDIQFLNNRAYGGGGALRIASEGSTATISNTSFSGNTAIAAGGGLGITSADVTIQQTSFDANQGLDGGAIALSNAHVLDISGSTFSGNSATQNGGAIYSPTGSTLNLSTSTLENNSATASGGAANGVGSVNVVRSLLVGNYAGDAGGAIQNSGGLTLDTSTLSGNSAPNGAGGGVSASGASLVLHDSTLADNSASSGDQFNAATGTTVTSNRNLFVGEASGSCSADPGISGSCNVSTELNNCGGGILATRAQIKLQPLADHGGPTRTLPLGLGSVAIDNAGAGCSGSTDQRGVSRFLGAACDAGAFEVDETLASGPAFVVNQADDLGDGFCAAAPGDCTLRDAVAAANSNVDASTITFDPTVFATPQTISLVQGEMLISTPTQISGPGSLLLDVDAQSASRHFEVYRYGSVIDVLLSGMTLRNGASNDNGGSILAEEQLSLSDMRLLDNAGINGSALNVRLPDSASFHMDNSTVSGNQGSGYAQGAVWLYGSTPMIDIQSSSIDHNTNISSSGGRGGGLYIRAMNGGSISISDSDIAANTLLAPLGPTALGAGLFLAMSGGGMTTLVRTAIVDNVAGGPGYGSGRGGGLSLDALDSTLLIEDSTLSGNQAKANAGIAASYAGGVLFLGGTAQATMRRTTVSANISDNGVGGLQIRLADSSTFELADSTLSGNTALTQAGGIQLFGPGHGWSASVLRSTITGNTAGNNTAYSGGGGGLLFSGYDDQLLIRDSIIAGNTDREPSPKPDLWAPSPTPPATYNSLIGDNRGTFFVEAQPGMPDANNNLIGSVSGAGIIDPQLHELADNGGYTLTHRPIGGSPALDRFTGCSGTDQRGAPRGVDFDHVFGNDCDVGAVEYLRSEDTLFADGFEAAPITLAFAKHQVVMDKTEIDARLAGHKPGRAVTVARATQSGKEGLVVIEARRMSTRTEVRLQRYEHGQWITGRWHALIDPTIELRW